MLNYRKIEEGVKKLFTTPTDQMGKASRFLVFQLKLWTHCGKLLIKNRSGQQAAALSYHTIFGIVPLAIMVLLIFQSFPAYKAVGDRFKAKVYNELRLDIKYPNPDKPGEVLAASDRLDEMVNGFFAGLNDGRIALVSTIIILWAAIGLLSTIERSFNNIWHVGKGRNILHRVINYWAILTLGPLLLGAGIYASAWFSTLTELQRKANIAPAIVSYCIAVVVFFLLYYVLPNTKVQAKAAIWGALVAAFVWSLAKWGFSVYVTKLIPYSEVYGVLGLIPLTIFWIYVSWLIVLFGLQLTFTTQHLKSLDAAEIAMTKRRDDYFIANDITVFRIVGEIAESFEKGSGAIGTEIICSKLDIPIDFGDKILNHLVRAGIIMRVSDPKVGYVPAKEPENILLSDISKAVVSAGFAQHLPTGDDKFSRIWQENEKLLSGYNIKKL